MKPVYKTTLYLLLILLLSLPTTNAISATFTPNPSDAENSGPLPQSLEQRKQLLQLSVAIANSPDPSSTLSQVAQQNGVSSEELAGMLDRNTQDLQQNGLLDDMLQDIDANLAVGGRGVSGTLPRRMVSLFTSIVVGVAKSTMGQVARHPRQSSLLAMVLVLTLLTIHNIPRNGLILSTPFSRGHTTMFDPPMSYMESLCEDSWSCGGWESSLPEPTKIKKSKAGKLVGGVGMTRSLVTMSEVNTNEVEIETQLDKEGFSLITSASQSISINDFIEDEESEEETMEIVLESITDLFRDRKFSEYTADKTGLKWKSFVVSNEEDEVEGAVLSMRLLGDFGRFGIQPLCFSYELDDEDDNDSTIVKCVAFHTLKGGHFDGELRFSIDTIKSGVTISVTLAVPTGGRTPPTRLAESMVQSFTDSIIRSSKLRIKQATSRRNQSKHYRARASGRAAEKRHARYEQEKNQEEMAAERKRRWKRNNPDAGHYRPSGHRLRSPGGSPNFSA